jgi:hypothetical protein
VLVGASDLPEPAGKDAVRILNGFLKFARRLPFDYFSEIRLPQISEESMCPRTAAVPTANVLFCIRPECQRRRRADYHRRKLEADPEYRQIAHDCQKKWREAHPDYLPRYRAQHPEANERNRERQRRRDQKRRIRRLEKNNLAEIWMVGPRAAYLDQNNLASTQVFIFEQLDCRTPAPTRA